MCNLKIHECRIVLVNEQWKSNWCNMHYKSINLYSVIITLWKLIAELWMLACIYARILACSTGNTQIWLVPLWGLFAKRTIINMWEFLERENYRGFWHAHRFGKLLSFTVFMNNQRFFQMQKKLHLTASIELIVIMLML